MGTNDHVIEYGYDAVWVVFFYINRRGALMIMVLNMVKMTSPL